MTTTAEIISVLTPAPGLTSYATAINKYGTVVGYESNANTNTAQGFMDTGGSVTLLSPSTAYALAINDYDEVAGGVKSSGQSETAAEWFYGLYFKLPITAAPSAGNAINDAGTIAGSASLGPVTQGFIVSGSTVTLLNSVDPAAAASVVYGLNNSGVAVGYLQNGVTNPSPSFAFSWQNGTVTLLPSLSAGDYATAYAINDAGLIVGASGSHAVEWKNGTIVDLGLAQGFTGGFAAALNDDGQIVGTAYDAKSNSHAVLWQNGSMTDLNSLLPANSGWMLQSATGINDQGFIVGNGLYNGIQTAFEITLDGVAAPLHTFQAVWQLYGALHSAMPNQTIVDSSGTISANIDLLQTMASKLTSISFSDTSPVLDIAATQFAADGAAIAKITGSFSVVLDEGAANQTLTGLSGHQTTVQFGDPISDYSITAIDGGTGFQVVETGTGRTSTDIFHNVSGLIFGDGARIYTTPLGITAVQSLGFLGAGTLQPSSINNAGIAVGSAGVSQVPTGAVAFYWTDSDMANGTLTSLTPLSGANGTEANHINDNGLVVGQSYKGNSIGSGSSTAVYWTSANIQNGNLVPTSIGWLPGDFASIAIADNNQGAIVGMSYTTSTTYQGFLWQNGTMSKLGTLGGGQVEPLSINSSDMVTGKASVAGGAFHAFIWQNGVMTDLGTLAGGTTSVGEAINDSGVVAGFATDSAGNDHAALWTNGQMTELPSLTGFTVSFANSENSKGWVVGEANNGTGEVAVLWANGAIYNLNSFLPANTGWILGDATSINDHGQVIGIGTDGGQLTGFELTLPTSLTLTSTTAVNEFNGGQLTGPVAISDSAVSVAANIDGLQALAAKGDLGSIALTDSGTPSLLLSAAQLSADSAVLNQISGPYTLTVTAGAAAISITAPSAHATTVEFIGTASQFTLGAANGAVTVTGNGVTDHLSGVLQIAFNDLTVTIAQTNSLNEYTALLYQGSLGRTPDAGGLESWETLVNALPSSTKATGVYGLSDASGNFNGSLSIAAGFTNSAEFTAKYGSLTDSQFVTQLYSNILDRAPDTAGFNSWLGELGSGQSREHVLIGFAESAEAVSNATQGFTGQHGTHAAWLFLT